MRPVDAGLPAGAGQTERLDRQVQRGSRVVLSVVEGPDAGLSVAVRDGVTALGTAPDSALRLTDPSVSRFHATVTSSPEGLVIEDRGSTNGTEVNGVVVKVALVPPGSRIRLGKTVIALVDAPAQTGASTRRDDESWDLIGDSPAMRPLQELLRKVGPTDSTVVIRGETGTGKEVVARTIHRLSARRDGPFVVLDCANVNPDLLGSELFGHVKGAFTGATGNRPGAFCAANSGTLFLDEIGELPPELQARLLGVLERRQVQPLGATLTVPVNVRVLAATHRDLEAMIQDGGFREDLYFRLAVVTVDLPPLRERPEDIPRLVERFLRDLAGPRARTTLQPGLLERLQQRRWKGNVRELRNAVERALVLAGGDVLTEEHFPERAGAASGGSPTPSGRAGLEDAERQMILNALLRAGGNKSKASRHLGMPLSTLKRRIKAFGLDRELGLLDEPDA